jgi:hypothetical protein
VTVLSIQNRRKSQKDWTESELTTTTTTTTKVHTTLSKLQDRSGCGACFRKGYAFLHGPLLLECGHADGGYGPAGAALCDWVRRRGGVLALVERRGTVNTHGEVIVTLAGLKGARIVVSGCKLQGNSNQFGCGERRAGHIRMFQ